MASAKPRCASTGIPSYDFSVGDSPIVSRDGDFLRRESVAIERKRVRKAVTGIIKSSDQRGNLAVEKAFESRTGQTSFDGKAHMDSIFTRDMEEIDAAFEAIADELYEDYDGEY